MGFTAIGPLLVLLQMPAPAPRCADVLAPFLAPELADGFDFPLGDADGRGSYTAPDGRRHDGYYVAAGFAEHYDLGIHTGEDWNGSGGGDSDLGQPVHASAAGTVVFAGDAGPPFGNVVTLEHRYLDHDGLQTVFTQYDHLAAVAVRAGQRVARRERLGTVGKGTGGIFPAHLHFEIRKGALAGYPPSYWPSTAGKDTAWVKEHYEPPSAFVRAHRRLTVPAREPLLLAVAKHCYQLVVLEAGRPAAVYEVGLSQAPLGGKQRQGDNRLPEGLYRIVQKAVGPFPLDRWENAYLGRRWMRLSYPNPADADRGLRAGLVGPAEHRAIVSAHAAGRTPPQDTKLGGGIGIHGWITPEWKNDGPRDLTWGCITMHGADLERLYAATPEGTPVLIVP